MNTEIKKESLKKNVLIQDLGLIDYAQAYATQKKWVEAVIGGHDPVLILCEHPAVLTLGRLASPENFLLPLDEIKAKGIQVLDIDRGGEVTLHSPGQLVIYPIIDLKNYGKDLKQYLHQLEQVAIDLLRDFDILADRFSGRTGAWVGQEKIVSIGVGVRKWTSFHGLAINVNTDLKLFDLIRPCGLDVRMTSIQKVKSQFVDMKLIKTKVVDQFRRQFQLTPKVRE
jgi:lipoyl(octanoyl) transferase